MITSGIEAKSTSSDSAVQLMKGAAKTVHIVNEGSVAGFFSLFGSEGPWARLPANGVLDLKVDQNDRARDVDLYIRRVAGGSNLSDVYGFGV